MPHSRVRLERALRDAWTGSTSVSPSSWTPVQAAVGQCAVTALVVQDHLGGEILRSMVGETSHYWNLLDDGTEIDLTREQFAEFSPGPTEVRSRAYLLSYPETRARYELLRERTRRSLEAARQATSVGT